LSGVVSPPSAELLRAVDLLGDGVTHLLDAREWIPERIWRYESTADALNLFYLAMRQISAITELALLWSAPPARYGWSTMTIPSSVSVAGWECLKMR
jgi:hypothetical protein